jgi:hypothetical protein
MRPLDPEGSAGTATAGLAAVAGLAALDTVADFAVFLMEGKQRFYQALAGWNEERVSALTAALISSATSGRSSVFADSCLTKRFWLPEPHNVLQGSD